jgi:hypothetical protein
MNTLLQGLRYGARRLRSSAQPQVFAKVVANWLIESPQLVLSDVTCQMLLEEWRQSPL